MMKAFIGGRINNEPFRIIWAHFWSMRFYCRSGRMGLLIVQASNLEVWIGWFLYEKKKVEKEFVQ